MVAVDAEQHWKLLIYIIIEMFLVFILPFQSQNYKYVQDTLFALIWGFFSSFKVLVELKLTVFPLILQSFWKHGFLF